MHMGISAARATGVQVTPEITSSSEHMHVTNVSERPEQRQSWAIYGLVDPRDARIRYVGCTINPRDRVGCHVSSSKYETSPKAGWVRELVALDLRPIFVTLQIAREPWEASEAERKWIAKLPGLTNRARGGALGPHQ